MDKEQEKLPPLEQGLLTALQAIDKQVARAMQRSPKEREEKGVQKWEPYEDKIERIVSYILSEFSEKQIQLDSVLISAQALVKTLQMIASELERNGLGKLRTTYCTAAFDAIEKDILIARGVLEKSEHIN